MPLAVILGSRPRSGRFFAGSRARGLLNWAPEQALAAGLQPPATRSLSVDRAEASASPGRHRSANNRLEILQAKRRAQAQVTAAWAHEGEALPQGGRRPSFPGAQGVVPLPLLTTDGRRHTRPHISKQRTRRQFSRHSIATPSLNSPKGFDLTGWGQFPSRTYFAKGKQTGANLDDTMIGRRAEMFGVANLGGNVAQRILLGDNLA